MLLEGNREPAAEMSLPLMCVDGLFNNQAPLLGYFDYRQANMCVLFIVTY